jgi:chemotaxis response regulator CheB
MKKSRESFSKMNRRPSKEADESAITRRDEQESIESRGDLNKESKVAKSEDDLFPIVGVGASAGGLEAFTRLIKHLPADTGMAFVLVQHLDPETYRQGPGSPRSERSLAGHYHH